MGKGCSPSGGIYTAAGRIGSLNANGEPNSRTDLYDDNGELIQSRWYDEEGWAIRNRDYRHGDGSNTHKFPHDHVWNWSNRIPRSKESFEPDLESFC